MDQPPTINPTFHTEVQESKEEKVQREEVERLELNGKGQREREGEASLCFATGTKEQHGLVQQPACTAVTMTTVGGGSSQASHAWQPVATASRITYPPREEEEAGGETPPEEREPGVDMDLSPPPADSTETTDGLRPGVLSEEGWGSVGLGY